VASAKPKKQPALSGPKLELAFWRACHKGNLKRVEKLLAEGADPLEGHPMYGAPLIAAAYSGNVDVVTLLLAHGASLTDYGAPAIEAAAGLPDTAVFDLLVARGALDARSGGKTIGYSPGQTALSLVMHGIEGALAGTRNAKAAHAELVVMERRLDRLLAAGADRELASEYGTKALKPIEYLHSIYRMYGDEILASALVKQICERIVKLLK
jgi:hypothetical protein